MGGPLRSLVSGDVVDPESAREVVLVSFLVAVIKYPDPPKNKIK